MKNVTLMSLRIGDDQGAWGPAFNDRTVPRLIIWVGVAMNAGIFAIIR